MRGAKGLGFDLGHKTHTLNHAHDFANQVPGRTILTNVDVDFHIVV